MILFVSKRLSEHKNFTKLIDLFILTTRKTFYSVDNDFIYKKLALDLLAYMGLLKEQSDFVGYGSFLGLFNSITDDYNIKFNNTEYTIPTLVESLKTSLNNIIPFEFVFLKNVSLISQSSNNIIHIEENKEQTERLLSKLNSKTVLRLDLTNTNTNTESFKSLLTLRHNFDVIPINLDVSETELAKTVVMLHSLLNPNVVQSVKLECTIKRKDNKEVEKDGGKTRAEIVPEHDIDEE